MQQSRVEQGAEYIRTQTAMLLEKKTHYNTKALFHCREIICSGFSEDLGKHSPEIIGWGVPLTPKYP